MSLSILNTIYKKTEIFVKKVSKVILLIIIPFIILSLFIQTSNLGNKPKINKLTQLHNDRMTLYSNFQKLEKNKNPNIKKIA